METVYLVLQYSRRKRRRLLINAVEPDMTEIVVAREFPQTVIQCCDDTFVATDSARVM